MLLLQQVVLKLHQLKRAHPQKLITSNQLHLKVLGGGSASAEPPAKPTETKPGGTDTGNTDSKSEAGKEVGSSSSETGAQQEVGGKSTDKKETGDAVVPGKMNEGSNDSKDSTGSTAPSNTVSNPEATDTEHSV